MATAMKNPELWDNQQSKVSWLGNSKKGIRVGYALVSKAARAHCAERNNSMFEISDEERVSPVMEKSDKDGVEKPRHQESSSVNAQEKPEHRGSLTAAGTSVSDNEDIVLEDADDLEDQLEDNDIEEGAQRSITQGQSENPEAEGDNDQGKDGDARATAAGEQPEPERRHRKELHITAIRTIEELSDLATYKAIYMTSVSGSVIERAMDKEMASLLKNGKIKEETT